MKYSNLSKVFLTVLLATQLYDLNAFARTKVSRATESGKLQIETRELTDEEALEYINEEHLEVDIDKNVFDAAITANAQNYDPYGIGNTGYGVPGYGNTGYGVPGYGNNGFGLDPFNQQQIPQGKLGDAFMVVDKLMAVGERMTPIIVKGKPALDNQSMKAISVLPRSLTTDKGIYVMDNWSYPETKYFNATLKGISGLTAATIRYGVTYQHSGRYGGKGKYLTGVRVSVKKVNLDWGYDLDAKSELVNISNVGQNGVIVAGATLEIQYTLKHILKTKMNSMQIFVTGDNKVKIN